METSAPLWQSNKAKRRPLRMFTIVITTILLVGLAFATGYYFLAYTNLKISVENEQNPNTPLLEKLAKLVILPKGEEPSIATVSDVSKLKEQTFFKNAQNGDSIVAYPNAQIAILYRSSSDLVVWMGPIVDKQNVLPTPSQKAP